MINAKTKLFMTLGTGALISAISIAEIASNALSYEKNYGNHKPEILIQDQEETERNNNLIERLSNEYEFKNDWKPISDKLKKLESYFKKTNLSEEQISHLEKERQNLKQGLSNSYIQNSVDLEGLLWESLIPDVNKFFKEQNIAIQLFHKTDCTIVRKFNDNSGAYSDRLFRLSAEALNLYSIYHLDKEEKEKRIKSFFVKSKQLESLSPYQFIKFLDVLKNNILHEEILPENL